MRCSTRNHANETQGKPTGPRVSPLTTTRHKHPRPWHTTAVGHCVLALGPVPSPRLATRVRVRDTQSVLTTTGASPDAAPIVSAAAMACTLGIMALDAAIALSLTAVELNESVGVDTLCAQPTHARARARRGHSNKHSCSTIESGSGRGWNRLKGL